MEVRPRPHSAGNVQERGPAARVVSDDATHATFRGESREARTRRAPAEHPQSARRRGRRGTAFRGECSAVPTGSARCASTMRPTLHSTGIVPQLAPEASAPERATHAFRAECSAAPTGSARCASAVRRHATFRAECATREPYGRVEEPTVIENTLEHFVGHMAPNKVSQVNVPVRPRCGACFGSNHPPVVALSGFATTRCSQHLRSTRRIF
jgi:hypothetical protein